VTFPIVVLAVLDVCLTIVWLIGRRNTIAMRGTIRRHPSGWRW